MPRYSSLAYLAGSMGAYPPRNTIKSFNIFIIIKLAVIILHSLSARGNFEIQTQRMDIRRILVQRRKSSETYMYITLEIKNRALPNGTLYARIPFCPEPLRIQVRIDSPYPFVCRTRRLNGVLLRMRPENPGPNGMIKILP
jgi:hypothetical protein